MKSSEFQSLMLDLIKHFYFISGDFMRSFSHGDVSLDEKMSSTVQENVKNVINSTTLLL